ncbi:hypothetical protein AB0J47_31310 [Nocardia sp. NPDC049737]|uniref:hypothetical protein n=1 Tax=Nocardia sp. NPDC049737 TaxID=3154358 RepID=UPI00343095BF
MRHTLTPDENAALDELLPPDRRTGDMDADLAAAIRVALARREDNARLCSAVIVALHRRTGSWRTLERLTGIPQRTARRWVGKALR